MSGTRQNHMESFMLTSNTSVDPPHAKNKDVCPPSLTLRLSGATSCRSVISEGRVRVLF